MLSPALAGRRLLLLSYKGMLLLPKGGRGSANPKGGVDFNIKIKL